jgi:acyl transferase domain-containing protein
VGAALAVLAERRRQQPLTMAASKSWVGHAEPAAGLVGLLFAQQAATGQVTLPIMHLATVNPYVGSTLEQTPHAAVLLPKQDSALPKAPQTQPGSIAFGVSAFAFMGTNAHALVAAGGSSSTSAAGASLRSHTQVFWQRKRHYVLPEANLLACAALVPPAVGQRQVVLQADLQAAALSFLWHHQVMGKAIFPGGYWPPLHFLRVLRMIVHAACRHSSSTKSWLL